MTLSKREKNELKTNTVYKYLKKKKIDFKLEKESYKFTIYFQDKTIEYWASKDKWHIVGETEFKTNTIEHIVNKLNENNESESNKPLLSDMNEHFMASLIDTDEDEIILVRKVKLENVKDIVEQWTQTNLMFGTHMKITITPSKENE